MQLFRNFLKNNKGATAIEYGLIAALIAIGLVTSFSTLRTAIAGRFTTISNSMNSAT